MLKAMLDAQIHIERNTPPEKTKIEVVYVKKPLLEGNGESTPNEFDAPMPGEDTENIDI